MKSVRVASLQYYMRSVVSFEDFASRVESLVSTAAESQVKILLFPEYFTTQLIAIEARPGLVRDHVRHIATMESKIVGLLSSLAKRYQLIIVGGTLPGFDGNGKTLLNKCYVFGKDGKYEIQAKLHMTRFEKEDWIVSPGSHLKIFNCEYGKFAVTICYDVEIPEVARLAARSGATMLFVPSCTDDRQGYLRVRYCAQARAIENQMFVIHASTVGSLPDVPAIAFNYGMSAIYTPSDFSFARDGILAEGTLNQEAMVIGDLNLSLIEENRLRGTVLPLSDSLATSDRIASIKNVNI